jgi:hypothetical protein
MAKNAKERTVLQHLNIDGKNEWVPIVVGKSLKPHCFKNIKKLPVTYYANKNMWMTTTIFTQFLLVLNTFKGVQGRNILLPVDNCAAHPQDMSFIRNVKVVYYPPNRTSMSQPLDLCIIRWCKQFYTKHLALKDVCLTDLGEGYKTGK